MTTVTWTAEDDELKVITVIDIVFIAGCCQGHQGGPQGHQGREEGRRKGCVRGHPPPRRGEPH